MCNSCGCSDKSSDEIRHDIEAMHGSMDSRDPSSSISQDISSHQQELSDRGESQLGANLVVDSNRGGPPSDD